MKEIQTYGLRDLSDKDLAAFMLLLSNMCRKVTRSDRETIGELTNDILVKMLEKNLPVPDHPVTWTYLVARNTWISKTRKRKGQNRVKDYFKENRDVSYEPDYLQGMGKEEMINKLYEMIETLPEKEKGVVYRKLESKSTKEIAQEMGIGEVTVKVRYYRATQRMMKLVRISKIKNISNSK